MYTVTQDQVDPIKQWYPTTVWLDYLDINKETLIDLVHWAKLQPWNNVGRSHMFTTRGGDQLMPDKPLWEYDTAPGINELMPQVQAAADSWMQAYSNQPNFRATPNFAHFVFYESYGQQWPHYHKCTWTAVLGLQNNGTIILQDPRPIAISQGHMLLKEVIINPGQLFIAPGYLIHSTAAVAHERDVLVFMGD